MEKWTYALLLIGSISIPMIRSFESRVQFYRQWKALFAGIFVMMLVFIPWDIIFTHHGIWSFNHDFVLGWYILGLPFEEWLFFIVIPYCVMFTYEVLKYFFPKFYMPKTSLRISLALGVFFLVLALFNTSQTYTLTVMLLTSALLFGQVILKTHKSWLSHYYLTYVITLIPFFIVNGILTSFPVVSYIDAENLGLRLYTIPAEDTVYLMGMMLIVTMIFEFVKKKGQHVYT
ncbi:MAG: lycopene cyclase domain-containing protein [Bacteroidales bacterium]|nr:lycopene cyclase domain-containing protein [Bacteroidales bacterium]